MIVVDGVEMVDVREAARLAGRTPETVRRWVWSGRIDAVKQGNRLLLVRKQIPDVAASTGEPRPGVSLREWAVDVAATVRGPRGATASDLVRADRAGRS